MLDSDTESMTAELAEELARSEPRGKVVDPRDVPWRHHHLRAIGRSAAHCYESFQSEIEQTLSMRLGSGAHALCFGKPVELWDKPAANGKGGKAPRNGGVWDEFKAKHAGAVILNRKEMDKAERIARSLQSHPEASRLLFAPGVLHESTILWEQNGRARRTTPDAVGTDYVCELKTTKRADPDWFAREARQRGYHAQVADQIDAYRSKGGPCEMVTEGYIVAIETVSPYVVTVLRLTDRALEEGRKMNRLWIERLCACADANAWPGYLTGIGDLDVPDEDVQLVGFEDDDEDEDEDEDTEAA